MQVRCAVSVLNIQTHITVAVGSSYFAVYSVRLSMSQNRRNSQKESVLCNLLQSLVGKSEGMLGKQQLKKKKWREVKSERFHPSVDSHKQM